MWGVRRYKSVKDRPAMRKQEVRCTETNYERGDGGPLQGQRKAVLGKSWRGRTERTDGNSGNI